MPLSCSATETVPATKDLLVDPVADFMHQRQLGNLRFPALRSSHKLSQRHSPQPAREKPRSEGRFQKVVIGFAEKIAQVPLMLKILIPIAFMLTNSISQAGGEFRHIVLFKFKDTATPAQVAAVEKAFGELPAKIDTITGYEWGMSESVEGKNDGLTHCFFVTFKDKAGLETYIPHPAHVAFKEILIPILEKALVFDYTAKD